MDSGAGGNPPPAPPLGNAIVRAWGAEADGDATGIRNGLEAFGRGMRVVDRGVLSCNPTGRTEFGTTLLSVDVGRRGCGTTSGEAAGAATSGCGAAGAEVDATAAEGCGAFDSGSEACAVAVGESEASVSPGLVLNQLEKEKAMRLREEGM
jgi:hypothetical protein